MFHYLFGGSFKKRKEKGKWQKKKKKNEANSKNKSQELQFIRVTLGPVSTLSQTHSSSPHSVKLPDFTAEIDIFKILSK